MSEERWSLLIGNDPYHATCPAYSLAIGNVRDVALTGDYQRAVASLNEVITTYAAWEDQYGILPMLKDNSVYADMLADPAGYLLPYALGGLWGQGRSLAEQAGAAGEGSAEYNDLITQAAARFQAALDLDPTFMNVDPRNFAERVARGEA